MDPWHLAGLVINDVTYHALSNPKKKIIAYTVYLNEAKNNANYRYLKE